MADEKKYRLVFDDVMVERLRTMGRDGNVRQVLSTMFDKMEVLGPRAGNLVDPRLSLYEMKAKHPPLRLYFQDVASRREVYVFDVEMKTSPARQQRTIGRIQEKIREIFRNRHPRA